MKPCQLCAGVILQQGVEVNPCPECVARYAQNGKVIGLCKTDYENAFKKGPPAQPGSWDSLCRGCARRQKLPYGGALTPGLCRHCGLEPGRRVPTVWHHQKALWGHEWAVVAYMAAASECHCADPMDMLTSPYPEDRWVSDY
jgi:hypothetical protein